MRLCCDSMRLQGSIYLTFGEPGPLPFTAWDMNRLELTARGVRGGTPSGPARRLGTHESYSDLGPKALAP